VRLIRAVVVGELNLQLRAEQRQVV
jgi:hypothetical protein